MSNNVESRLYIKGDPTVVSEFLVKMQDADNSFLMAHGPIMDKNHPLKESSNIGQWKEEYWGCKSHDQSVEVTELDWSSISEEDYAYNTSEQVRISFETPWSPPLEGITYIANKIKNLEFKIFYLIVSRYKQKDTKKNLGVFLFVLSAKIKSYISRKGNTIKLV